jgi:hypothetical protein
MNEKWRDYSKYTDKQLDELLKGFAGQADYPAVVFEYQRRQNARREPITNHAMKKPNDLLVGL